MSELETIIEITPAAVDKIDELISGRGRGELAVRVALRGRLPGGGFQSEFKFVDLDDKTEDDLVQDTGKFKFYIDQEAASSIGGAVVDFDENRYTAGFHIEYPQQIADNPASWRRKDWDDPLAIAVQKVIDEQINPGVAGHGGWVVLEDVSDNKAFVEMGGGCQGCGLSAVTLRQGIESMILHHVPEIEAVVDITDHEVGENPYYTDMEGQSALGD